MLGSSIFKNRYGSDPAIIGRTIRINEIPTVVIGVMPEGFRFPENADLWQRLDELAARHQIKWCWVKGHAGHAGNERADALANRGMDELQRTRNSQ